MTHLIQFEAGEKYCTLCGTNDFSTACKYNKEMMDAEYALRERYQLLKESDQLLKVSDQLLKEKEVAIKEKQVRYSSWSTALGYFLFFLALYVIFSGFRDLRAAIVEAVAVCNKGGWFAVVQHLLK